MVGHGGSSASSYLANPTSPISSHCAPVVMTSTLRVNAFSFTQQLAMKKNASQLSLIQGSYG